MPKWSPEHPVDLELAKHTILFVSASIDGEEGVARVAREALARALSVDTTPH